MKILYLCPDAGIPVLGHKGAAVHVRELIAAFARANHQVVLATPVLNKSPWEKPEPVAATLLHLRLSAAAQGAVLAARDFSDTLCVESSLSSELRRILYNQELKAEISRRFDADPPDFIYERASLHSTSGAALARAFNVPPADEDKSGNQHIAARYFSCEAFDRSIASCWRRRHSGQMP